MKERKVYGILSVIFFLIGMFFIINSKMNITGAAIGVFLVEPSSIIGIIMLIFSVVLTAPIIKKKRLEEKIEKIKIGRLYYDIHAGPRLEQRALFPSVIEDAVKYGEHYFLKHVKSPEKTRGATDVYIKRHTAEIMKGKLGERIIEINPKRNRKYKNIMVLTGKEGVVKTAYVGNDKELKEFLTKYVRKTD